MLQSRVERLIYIEDRLSLFGRLGFKQSNEEILSTFSNNIQNPAFSHEHLGSDEMRKYLSHTLELRIIPIVRSAAI